MNKREYIFPVAIMSGKAKCYQGVLGLVAVQLRNLLSWTPRRVVLAATIADMPAHNDCWNRVGHGSKADACPGCQAQGDTTQKRFPAQKGNSSQTFAHRKSGTGRERTEDELRKATTLYVPLGKPEYHVPGRPAGFAGKPHLQRFHGIGAMIFLILPYIQLKYLTNYVDGMHTMYLRQCMYVIPLRDKSRHLRVARHIRKWLQQLVDSKELDEQIRDIYDVIPDNWTTGSRVSQGYFQ